MKTLILLLLMSLNSFSEIKEIVTFPLDSKKIFTVYCHEANTGVTTVLFPSEISGIYAAKVDVKFNKENPNPFLLAFTPGSSHFTIKSLSAKNAAGAINVLYRKKVYVIHLKTVPQGHSSVSFLPYQRPSAVTASVKTPKTASAPLLLSMLDKAKAYHLIKKHYPAQVEGIHYDAPATVMNYSNFQILLKEVIRYDLEDCIFFHIQIKNKGQSELRYNPKDFAVNISDKIFYSVLSDASGIVPANEVSIAWFCILGTKAGGRNNLAVKNDWKILLNLSPKVPVQQKKEIPIKPEADQEGKEKKTLPLIEDLELEEVQP